uniref:Uncharacterized protein n=1 Tax=Lactuca sativa TaxID=4236 RepID=A0A9R1VZM2_LACSA|nr:hypothetical protein LSAT_V11C400181040 [Lactuca sativa]
MLTASVNNYPFIVTFKIDRLHVLVLNSYLFCNFPTKAGCTTQVSMRPSWDLPSSPQCQSVVEMSDGVSFGLQDNHTCITCEIIVQWLNNQLAHNLSRDNILN